MSPTSRQDPGLAQKTRDVLCPPETVKEWLPLWLAGPVLALMTIGGLIVLLMLAAEVYTRLSQWLS